MSVWNDYVGEMLGSPFMYLFSIIGQSLEDGAASAIYLAASPHVMENNARGQYFIPIAKPDKITLIASDMKLAHDLWVSTCPSCLYASLCFHPMCSISC
jgi:hypothetical protein